MLALSPLVQDFLGLGEALRFPGAALVQFALASAVFAYGGWPFLQGLWRELRRRSPGMMTLVGLAITVAYVYSSAVVLGLVAGAVFFWELATLVVVMLLGHWIEMRSVMGASRALESLAELMPATAHRLTPEGDLRDVPLQSLQPGDRVRVKPGEKVPTDGRIVEGRSSVSEALLTGESRPVDKGAGDAVIGGSLNGEAAFTVEVEKTGAETYLAQVIEMVDRARASRSRTQDLADRAAMWLTVIALAAGGLTLVSWLAAGRLFDFALERMVTVMVITCPHALGLAVPLVVAVSTALAARRGLLIRDRSAFERARQVDAIVFDKTGTLTEGRFGVTEMIPLGELAERDLLHLAAALESSSEHLIARGIVEHAREQGIEPGGVGDFEAIPGQGARARIDGRQIKVVSPRYLEENGLAADDVRVRRAAGRGDTVVFVLVEGSLAGAIALADRVRPESKAALQRLREMGIQVMMVTGDAEPVARSVARTPGPCGRRRGALDRALAAWQSRTRHACARTAAARPGRPGRTGPWRITRN